MNDTDKCSEYITLLKENKNLILTGAPGTGKTYLAREIAKAMNAECEFVQFHPSYDYTDFVEGLRPTAPDRNGNVGFERKDGVFKELCKRAIAFNYKANSFDDAYKRLINAIKQNNVTLYSAFKKSGNTPLKVEVETKNENQETIRFWKTNRFKNANIDYLRKIYNYFVSKKQYDIKNETKKELFVNIIGNDLDYSYYRGIVQGLLDFTDKTSNESITLFEQCYNELLADIYDGLIDTVQLKEKESQKLSITQNNCIKWQRTNDESESANCVSLARLLKLYSQYNNVEKVDTMKNDSIKDII